MKLILSGSNGRIGKKIAEVSRLETVQVKGKFNELSNLQIDELWRLATSEGSTPFSEICYLGLAWPSLNDYESPDHRRHVDEHFSFIEKLASRGLSRIVMAGTAAEYGVIEGELTETTSCKPETEYGRAKFDFYQKLKSFTEHENLNLTWARIFHVYDNFDPVHKLAGSILAAAEDGSQMILSSPFDNYDYLSSTEVARLLVDLCEFSLGDGIVNVCSGVPRSNIETVRIICKDFNVRVNLKVVIGPEAEFAPRRWGSNSKMLEILQASGR